VAKKKAATPAKRGGRLIRYLKEVRAEMGRVSWPTRKNTLNLTGIVLGVTVAMSIALGVTDWLFSKLFALILG